MFTYLQLAHIILREQWTIFPGLAQKYRLVIETERVCTECVVRYVIDDYCGIVMDVADELISLFLIKTQSKRRRQHNRYFNAEPVHLQYFDIGITVQLVWILFASKRADLHQILDSNLTERSSFGCSTNKRSWPNFAYSLIKAELSNLYARRISTHEFKLFRCKSLSASSSQ